MCRGEPSDLFSKHARTGSDRQWKRLVGSARLVYAPRSAMSEPHLRDAAAAAGSLSASDASGDSEREPADED
jgi:hypothetical protein